MEPIIIYRHLVYASKFNVNESQITFSIEIYILVCDQRIPLSSNMFLSMGGIVDI